MAIKELKTRIALKYDSYSAWTTAPGKDVVLLAGEIGICYIGDTNPESNVVPTVLFKVGDGTKTFENLPWASAKAADVYSWAKASDVVYSETNKTITFVKGNVDGSDKVITFNYVTLAEVQTITNDLDSRILALENRFTGESSVQGQIDALDERLDVIEGDGEGSVAKALVDAQDYTDEVIGDKAEGETAATGIRKEIADAEAAAVATAKTYTDGEVDKLEAEDLRLADEIGKNTTAISTVRTDFEAADLAINDKIGTAADGKDIATVYGAIAKAQADAEANAATTAQGKVDALANGQVSTNTGNIATNASEIVRVEGKLDTYINEQAELEHEARIAAMEAFFEGAATDEGEGENLKNALDTLKEIQEFATGEGTAAAEMLDAIQANTTAIDDLANATDGRVTLAEGRIAVLEAADAATDTTVKSLQDIVDGYSTKGSIKTAIEAAQGDATQALANAATADGKAVTAQGTADAVKAAVEHETTGLVATKVIADRADATSIANAGKLATAESEIDALQDIVSNGTDSNANLRSAITALQELTGDATKGNAALQTELSRVAGLVDNATTGLAATKDIADKNKTDLAALDGRVAAVENDYVKATDLVSDFYIFNCGSASAVLHTAPTEQ